MTPLDVMIFAMQHGLRVGALKTAASFAQQAAPYMHAKAVAAEDPSPPPSSIKITTIDPVEAGRAY
jgi:hypothetical protein